MFLKSIHLTFILHIWIPYTLEEYILKRMLIDYYDECGKHFKDGYICHQQEHKAGLRKGL